MTVKHEKEEENPVKSNVTNFVAPHAGTTKPGKTCRQHACNNTSMATHTTQRQWPHIPATTPAVRQEKEE
jgi:hypothetical protein